MSAVAPVVHARRPTGAALAALLAASLVVAAPAYADPPPNDDPAAATSITSVPTRVEVDTTEATAAPEDGRCVDGHSVWFSWRPTEDQRLPLTTAGSAFDTRLAVFRRAGGQRDLVACDNNDGPGRTSAVRFQARGGTRYLVAVSSRLSGPGGPAVLTWGRMGAPAVTVDIESATSGRVSGRLHLRGTVTCTTPSQLWMGGEVSQRIEATDGLDGVARGWGGADVKVCWTEPAPWHMRVDSETGLAFQPGPAAVELRIRGWDGIERYTRHVRANVEAVDDPAGRAAR
jgi:hypothetical protein